MPENSTTRADNARKWVAVAVAAVLLLVYICLVYRAWNATGNEAEVWARKVYLLGGIEALAFAAAGWFFGREVNRQAVHTLQAEVGEARGDADDARKGEMKALNALSRAQSEATALAASLKAMIGTLSPDFPPFANKPSRLQSQWSDLLGRADSVLQAYGEEGQGAK